MPPEARTGPVVLLGFDAADPDIVEQWAREGKLPAMARLMARGTWARTGGEELPVRARHLVHDALGRVHRAPWLPLLLAAGAGQLRPRAEARTRPRGQAVLGAPRRIGPFGAGARSPRHGAGARTPRVAGERMGDALALSAPHARGRAGDGGRRGTPGVRSPRADRREDRRFHGRGSGDRGSARRARGAQGRVRTGTPREGPVRSRRRRVRRSAHRGTSGVGVPPRREG